MVYGGTVPVITASYAGFVAGDTAASLTTGPTCTTTATSHSAVGSYPSNCTGAVDSNYTIGYVAGTVTVRPVPLTITASSGTMVYGGTVPTITASYAGFVNGDTAASLTTAPTCSTTATSHSAVGSYPSNCAGAVDANYTIGYVAGTVTVTVTPVPLTITASSGPMVYGGTVPVITAIYSGFVAGDTAASLTTAPTCSTTATSHSPVGSYPSSCTGAVDSNYTISYTPGAVTVTPATLTITASGGTMVYGAPVPTITASYAGFVAGDTAASLTTAPTCTTTATSHSAVGSYPSSCTGAVDANYTIGYVAGTVTVTPAPLIPVVTAADKVYDRTTTATITSCTLTGVLSGDTVTCTAASGAFGNANAGIGKTVTASGITIAGASAANYTAPTTATTTAKITPAVLTVTANNVTRPFGYPNPVFTASFSGFITGDTLANSVAGSPSLTTDATTLSSIGTYVITAAIGSLASQNYTFVFVNGLLTVSTAPSISLKKTASLLNYSMVRQIITYTYTITNTGNVALAGPFTVADDKLGAIACSADGLVPGASVSCTATHAVTKADLTAGFITNLATATGNGVTSNQAKATVFGAEGCTDGYPYGTPPALSSVVFNEGDVLQSFGPNLAYQGGTLKAWYNDERALLLGVRRVVVQKSSGTTTTDYAVTPWNTGLSALNPSVGTTALTGDQAGTDLATWNSTYGYLDHGRPNFPAIFLTDITADPNAKSGDWQQGGTPIAPHAVFGTWKAAVRTVDETRAPWAITITTDADPAKNHWNGVPDAPSGGFSSYTNAGYGAEVRWNVDSLGLVAGHTYRVQVMVHDGDENRAGGDTGAGCMVIVAQGVPDAAPVADDDSYSTTSGKTLTVPASTGVLIGDTDANLDTLTAIIVSNPANGTVDLDADGSFVYTPKDGFVGVDTFTYKANDGQLDSNVATVTITVTTKGSTTGFTTYTQGGWGSPPSGTNPGALLQAKFATLYPLGSVTIGGLQTLRFTSAAAINAFLPQGGKPAALQASAVNPTSSSAGVFAGQVLALQLNVDFSNAGITKPGFGLLKVKSGKLVGYTISQVLALANAVLGGANALSSGVSLSDLNGIVDSINENFDNGNVNNGFHGE
jgi:hypothetical protein